MPHNTDASVILEARLMYTGTCGGNRVAFRFPPQIITPIKNNHKSLINKTVKRMAASHPASSLRLMLSKSPYHARLVLVY